jgi:hypothetical protein
MMKTIIILHLFVCFPGETTFHTSGKVNRHNVRIWGLENPRVVLENEMDSPKVNVWCALMHNKVTGPFFFSECTISAVVYLGMMELLLHLRKVSAKGSSPTGWCPATLRVTCSSVLGCNVSRPMD